MKRVLAPFICILLCCACDTVPDGTYLTSRSTAGYQIRLRGNLTETPKAQFSSYLVMAQLAGVDLPAFEVFRADRMDFAFREVYPREEWIDPTTLRFISTYGKGQQTYRLTVLNSSPQMANRITVKCGDLILLFDVEPGRARTFEVPVSGYLAVEATFAGGRNLKLTDVYGGDSQEFKNGPTLEVFLTTARMSPSAAVR